MKTLTRYDLDYEKTLPYFIDHISSDYLVATILLKNTDFSSGSFFTLLPDEANKERMYLFSSGWILPPFGKRDSNYEVVPNIDPEVCDYVLRYLKQHSENIALLEDFIRRPTDRYINIPTVKTVFHHEEVYYLLNHKSEEDAVVTACCDVDMCWHCLMILSTGCPAIFKEFNEETILTAVNNARYIITSAYDGEGFVFWEKKIEA